MIDPDGYIARDPNAKLDNPVPASSRDAAINLPRNFCSQCGEPYLNADWYETLACGPSHAMIAAELRQSIRVQLAAPAAPPETKPRPCSWCSTTASLLFHHWFGALFCDDCWQWHPSNVAPAAPPETKPHTTEAIALIEKWRERASSLDEYPCGLSHAHGVRLALRKCAEELETLLAAPAALSFAEIRRAVDRAFTTALTESKYHGRVSRGEVARQVWEELKVLAAPAAGEAQPDGPK